MKDLLTRPASIFPTKAKEIVETAFQQAYWQVVSGIKASESTLRRLLPLLENAFTKGVADNGRNHVTALLPAAEWSWPAYEQQAPEIRRVSFDAQQQRLQTLDAGALLHIAGTADLRSLHAQLVGGKPPRQHNDLVAAIAHAAEAAPDGADILSKLRSKLIARLEDSYKSDPEGFFDPREKVLVDRIWHSANSLEQRRRMLERAESFPFFMLSVPEKWRARPECAEMDGCARGWNDPYWAKNFPPCERLNCLCGVIQTAPRQIEREHIKVIAAGDT